MSGKRTASSKAKQRARELRKQMTGPEKKLWSLIRDRRLQGEKFRRQHPIDEYIVDFYHSGTRLIIELNGESHSERGEYDQQRQERLEHQGYRFLRIGNDDVLKDEEAVLHGILKAIGKRIPE